MSQAFFTILCIVGYVVTTSAFAACTFNVPSVERELEVLEADTDGFPIVLGVPEDELYQVSLNCSADTLATLRISEPIRLKNGGPTLKGPLRSYFVLQDRRFKQTESANIEGALENEPVWIGMSIQNGESFLPASDAYKYQIMLTVSAREAD